MQVEHLTENAEMCTDIVGLVFDRAAKVIANNSELYYKDLEINRLELLLKQEKIHGKRRVKEACDLGKANLEDMVARCEYFHKTILANIHLELQRASKVSTVDALQQLRQTKFFQKSMQDLTDFAYESVSKTEF